MPPDCIWKATVLRLSIGEFGRIVGSKALYQVKGTRSLQNKFTHMTHIENTCIIPNCQVFVVDA